MNRKNWRLGSGRVKLMLIMIAIMFSASCKSCSRTPDKGGNGNGNLTVTTLPTPAETPISGETTKPDGTPTPTPSLADNHDRPGWDGANPGLSAKAFRLDDDAWIDPFKGERFDLTLGQPSKQLRHRDRLSTNKTGEALLTIFGCATTILRHETNLISSGCPGSSGRSGSLACVSGAITFSRDPIECARTITFETGSAVINLEGTYVDLYYYPQRQATVVMLSEGKASVFPVLRPGNRKHVSTLDTQPIVLDQNNQCMVTQPGLTAGPPIADVPQREVRPCEEFPAVLKELQQAENVKRAVIDIERNGFIPPGPFKTPVFRLDPSSGVLDFVDETVGKRKILELTIENAGLPPLIVSEFKFSGATEFVKVGGDCLNQPIERECKVAISFNPASIGERRAAISITHNAGILPDSVALIGRGVPGSGPGPGSVPPTISVKIDPAGAPLSFSTQKVGTSSTRQITVTNTGQATVKVGAPVPTGPGKNAFTIKNNCTGELAPNATCLIDVVFNPQTPEGFVANLSIGATEVVPANTSTPRIVALDPVEIAGKGAVPVISVGKSEVCFAKQKVVKKSDPKVREESTLVVTNKGEAPLSVGDVTVSNDDFKIVDNSCKGKDVAVAGECHVTVGFTPRDTRLREGTLTITHDDMKATPTTVPLKGVGKHRNAFVRFIQAIFTPTKNPCKQNP